MERVFNVVVQEQHDECKKKHMVYDREDPARIQLAVTAIDTLIALQKDINESIKLFGYFYSDILDGKISNDEILKLGNHISLVPESYLKIDSIDGISEYYGTTVSEFCDLAKKHSELNDISAKFKLIDDLLINKLEKRYTLYGGGVCEKSENDMAFLYNMGITKKLASHKCIDADSSCDPQKIIDHAIKILHNDWKGSRGLSLAEIFNLLMYRSDGTVNPTIYEKFHQFIYGRYTGVIDKSMMFAISASPLDFIPRTNVLREIIDFREGDYHKELSLSLTQFIFDFAQLIRYMELEEVRYLCIPKTIIHNDFREWFHILIEVICDASNDADINIPWKGSLIRSIGNCYNYEELELYMRFLWHCSGYEKLTKEQFEAQIKGSVCRFGEYPYENHTQYDNLMDEIRILAILYMALTKFNKSENPVNIGKLIDERYTKKIAGLKILNLDPL